MGGELMGKLLQRRREMMFAEKEDEANGFEDFQSGWLTVANGLFTLSSPPYPGGQVCPVQIFI